MDKETYGASGFEHGTVAGVLRQKGTLGFAARSQANSGPERVGKEPYFHLRSIAPSKTRDVSAGHGRSTQTVNGNDVDTLNQLAFWTEPA
jgi:hypothetical protein